MKWMQRIGLGLLVLLLVLTGLFGVAYLHAQSEASTVYAVQDPPLQLPVDSNAMAQGAHLYATRGCADCHGDDGRGKPVFDAGPVIRVVAANITPEVLKSRGYDADAIAAAIRHGVRADGTPLLFMPAGDWHGLGDADTAALVAYLSTLPAQPHDPGKSVLRPLGWVLNLFGRFPAFPASALDHAPRSRVAPEAVASVEFGGYVAQSCTGCHGDNLAGGKVLAPNTPVTANLTPTALKDWTLDDFMRAMREGKRPDGSAIDPFMPWQTFARMSDTELRALWAYLHQLPPA